jgi:hypothetical protein
MQPSGPIDAYHPPNPAGQKLAVVNESFQRKVVQEIKKAKSRSAAKEIMNAFWSRYGDRIAADDLAALMDELRDSATLEEILAGYGQLVDKYPKAKNWPAWVFTIVDHLVKAGRQEAALPWVKRLARERPESVWRANAEVLVNPATARSGRKPWVAARKLTEKPTLDGNLDEAVWQKRVSFKNTVFLDASKDPQPTEFAVAYDNEALYCAVKLLEPALSRIATRVDKDDGHVWADDSIVVYLDQTLSYNRYAQFIFNAAGVMWDGWGHRRGTEGPGSLTAAVQRTARLTEDAWQIEIRIPFKDLGTSCPPSGRVWGLGFQRWRHVRGALYTVWGNSQGTSLDNRAETFGFLVFD